MLLTAKAFSVPIKDKSKIKIMNIHQTKFDDGGSSTLTSNVTSFLGSQTTPTVYGQSSVVANYQLYLAPM